MVYPARTSRSTNNLWNIAKTFFQTFWFYLTFLVIFPYLILKMDGVLAWRPEAVSIGERAAGVVFFLLMTALGISSSMVMAVVGKGTPVPMDCPSRLVVRGAYRFVRNPMVIAGLGQGLAIAIYFRSAAMVVYVVLGGVLWQLIARPWEERDLSERFGEHYKEYRNSVKCWLPRFRPYISKDE